MFVNMPVGQVKEGDVVLHFHHSKKHPICLEVKDVNITETHAHIECWDRKGAFKIPLGVFVPVDINK